MDAVLQVMWERWLQSILSQNGGVSQDGDRHMVFVSRSPPTPDGPPLWCGVGLGSGQDHIIERYNVYGAEMGWKHRRKNLGKQRRTGETEGKRRKTKDNE